MNILVTGALGYIGSHICIDLLDHNFNIITVDFDDSNNVIQKIELISGKKILKHYLIDLSDKCQLEKVFQENNISVVIHLAGYKSIPESILNPLKYFKNNLINSITLLDVMAKYNCTNIIFSSSASVYSQHNIMPITEDSLLDTNNPYSFTKLSIEQMLQHLYNSDKSWKIIILRYFNPIGVHSSGHLPYKLDETGLISSIIKTLKGDQEYLKIYGKNYDTEDGTAVRDFIHIADLTSSHISSLEKIVSEKSNNALFRIYNIGTGTGITVLKLVHIINKLTDNKLKYIFTDERLGDIPKIYTSIDKIKKELNWNPQYNIDEACQSLFKI